MITRFSSRVLLYYNNHSHTSFGTDSRQIRSRSNSSRRIGGVGNEKGTTVNQPSSQQGSTNQQQKTSNINHSNGKQRPHTGDLHVGRSRVTSKSMKITSTSLSASSATTKTRQSTSSEAKHHLQSMYHTHSNV